MLVTVNYVIFQLANDAYFVGEEPLQIRDCGKGDEGPLGMAQATCLGNFDPRPDEGVEVENHTENRLGKPVSRKV